jgi:hypothetical protein
VVRQWSLFSRSGKWFELGCSWVCCLLNDRNSLATDDCQPLPPCLAFQLLDECPVHRGAYPDGRWVCCCLRWTCKRNHCRQTSGARNAYKGRYCHNVQAFGATLPREQELSLETSSNLRTCFRVTGQCAAFSTLPTMTYHDFKCL